MMYDTAIKLAKFYQHVMASWAENILVWAGGTQVLLGLPAYDDAGVGYHDPGVENLRAALQAVHAGLGRFSRLPDSYAGIAVYCEWEMDRREWEILSREFEKKP
jgi:hypothetical protein